MKALIKKEIRLLLPVWIIAMLLAVVPGIFNIACATTTNGGLFPFVLLMYAAGVLFLGITSFGEEMSYNTFSGLLSQPMHRPRIWFVKVATLATAFVSVWFTAILINSWQIEILHPSFENYKFSGVFAFLSLSALVAFSGGLWTTLLLRQVTGAFWFTLLTPLVIVLGIITVQDWIVPGQYVNTLIAGALVLYSIAGFFVARRLFMRAQDVQWSGGEISLPDRGRVSKTSWRRGTDLRSEATGGQVAALPIRPGHWYSALARKELQSHQGVFVIATIVLVLHLAAWTIRKFCPHIQNPDLDAALNVSWVLWLLMPLLVGATAIAEERRMGTLEPQLCLPVSGWAQLFVKFFVGLALSLFFGALVPVLIEGTRTLDYWRWIFVVAAAVFSVSFYASSLGRTTLQSIGLAILVAAAVRALGIGDGINSIDINSIDRNNQFFDTLELQIQYLDVAILLILFGSLTHSNFKHAHQDWKFWIRNVLATLVVFVCVRILNYLILLAGVQWYGRHYL